MKSRYFLHIKAFTVLLILSTIGVMAFGIREDNKHVKHVVHPVTTTTSINADSVASVTAFQEVYKVLMHPRCMNCHPKGDIPLQGDSSILHTMGPKRGKEGKGIYAMKCSNCHQATNTPGLNTPPGNPEWHLPPANMKMVFEGKTPDQLAKQLVDRKQNGNKTKQQLIEHAHDTLVLWGWNPGEGRSLPPLSHEEFVKVWTTWLNTGAYAPPRP